MQLHKTERARAALADRSGGLSAFERRILILSDGQRTAETLVSMLGAGAREGVERLLATGYLAAGANEGRTSTLHAARRLLGSIVAMDRDVPGGAAQAESPAPAAPHTGAPHPAPPTTAATKPAPARAPRRSLAASKMYVLDMLQLQRDHDARSLRANIQCSADPARLQAALLEALAFLQRSTPPSYSRRVLDRVAEILPEEALPALQAQREAIATAA